MSQYSASQHIKGLALWL